MKRLHLHCTYHVHAILSYTCWLCLVSVCSVQVWCTKWYHIASQRLFVTEFLEFSKMWPEEGEENRRCSTRRRGWVRVRAQEVATVLFHLRGTRWIPLQCRDDEVCGLAFHPSELLNQRLLRIIYVAILFASIDILLFAYVLNVSFSYFIFLNKLSGFISIIVKNFCCITICLALLIRLEVIFFIVFEWDTFVIIISQT